MAKNGKVTVQDLDIRAMKWKCVRDRYGGVNCHPEDSSIPNVNFYTDGDISINGRKVSCKSLGKGKAFMGTTTIWCKTDASQLRGKRSRY